MIKKQPENRLLFLFIIRFRAYPRKNLIIPCRSPFRPLPLQRMKTNGKPGSRQFIYCPIDLLRHRRLLRGAGSVLLQLLFFCLCLVPALLGSCTRFDEQPAVPDAPEPEIPAVDSVLLDIRFERGEHPVRRADLFIYDAGGIRPLERRVRLDGLPDTLRLLSAPGEKILVCIANSPREFNLNALARYDAMEQLAYAFTDDDPACPLLGAVCTTRASAGTLRPRPLLCRVRLAAVSNTLDDYELLEDPAVRLCDLPYSAEILREQDFRPVELIDAGAWTALPCDVGTFEQRPDIDLWCYPNDTPEEILGVPRPALEFRCKIRTETCSFEVPLPPLPRESAVEVDLTIDGPGAYRYIIRQK